MNSERRLYIIRILYGYKILKVDEIASFFHIGMGHAYELMKGARAKSYVSSVLQRVSDESYLKIMEWISNYSLDKHYDEIRTIFNLGDSL